MVECAPVGGIDLYYQDVGEGPPVVFLHGAGGNHLVWWQQVPAFADDYRCIVPDQRMYGLSADAPDGPGVEAFVDDLAALLDHLGVERAALVAQSMGGWTAAGFAAEHPDRVAALVLADTPAGIVDIDPGDGEVDVSRAYADALADELQFLYRSISGLNVHTPEGVVADLAAFDVDPGRLVEADLPVLVLAGEDDVLTPVPLVREVHERLDGSTFVTVPGAGHSVYFERPEEFNDLVAAFLDEHGY